MQKIILDSVTPNGRVAVAMSGGVDSSVAAAMLHKSGYQVVGITLQLYDHGKAINKKKACCAGQDIYDAKRVSEMMGFAHYVLDYESVFKQDVIDDFVESYMRGETPIPCVRCNQKVKFRDLLKTARDLNCEALVTGHYVQRIEKNGTSELHRAADHKRDQSYFLFSTTQSQLDYLRFPLGGFESKDITRQLAHELGLMIADKPDSQDICFVPEGKYIDLLAKMRPESVCEGTIFDVYGTYLGKHNGIAHYTIGQRKGIGVSAADPLYVIKINALENQIIVGPKEFLLTHAITLKEVNWLDQNVSDITIKIRSTHKPIRAQVISKEKDNAQIKLLDEEYGVSKGQACVFYHGNRVLGGGWINDVRTKEAV